MLVLFCIASFFSFFLKSAESKIEMIKAIEKPQAFPSLRNLACTTIIKQMRLSLEIMNIDEQKTIQKYICQSSHLPVELQETIKKKLAQCGMDILTSLHRNQPISPIGNWCLSPDGTLLLHQDHNNPGQFVLKNLNTQEEEIIGHAEFSGQTPDGTVIAVTPFITRHNSILFHSDYRTLNPRIFKYYPKTKTVEKSMLSIPIYHLLWASTDMNRLLFYKYRTLDTVLYDTQTSKQVEIRGCRAYNESFIDDTYITTWDSDRFYCHTIQDGRFYMQGGLGTGKSKIEFPYLICTKKSNPSDNFPTSIEVWDIPSKQPIRRVGLPCNIARLLSFNQGRFEITSYVESFEPLTGKKIFYDVFYTVNCKTGCYTKRELSSDDKYGNEYLTTETGYSLMTKQRATISENYVPRLLTRKLTIPLTKLTDITSCYATKDMTRISGLREGPVPFVYTTPLHTLYNTPLPELLSMLLKQRDNKTDIQSS